MSTVMRSRGTRPSSRRMAGNISRVGAGLVTSQTEIATVCPSETSWRRGLVPRGLRIAVLRAPSSSGRLGMYRGSTTVVRPSGKSTSMPSSP